MTASSPLPWLGRFAAAAFALLAIASPSLAQDDTHDGDIHFEYQDGMIEIEFHEDGPVFESSFPTSGGFAGWTDAPGFGTHDPIGVDDIIDYNVLGPLRYHDGTSLTSVPTGVDITIEDNPSGSLLVDAGTSGPVSGPGFIGQADGDGEVHAHIAFALDDQDLGSDAYGAYGLDLELFTDADGIDNSDPFTIVFNYGLDETTFDATLSDFTTTAVPEPGTAALAGMIAAFTLVRRRRRRSA